MTIRRVGLLFGVAFGFVMAWARLTDPSVIRRMLLLQEPDIFLLMGLAIGVAGIGVRVLRASGVRALATGEPIAWKLERPRARHLFGSVLFGAGWSLAGTCPGPLAAMIGQGRVGGLFVVTGLIAGVVMQGALNRRQTAKTPSPLAEAAVGL